jgi:hypothetical protein
MILERLVIDGFNRLTAVIRENTTFEKIGWPSLVFEADYGGQ